MHLDDSKHRVTDLFSAHRNLGSSRRVIRARRAFTSQQDSIADVTGMTTPLYAPTRTLQNTTRIFKDIMDVVSSRALLMPLPLPFANEVESYFSVRTAVFLR